MGGGIDQSVSPGIGGFLAFFLLAVALWLLMRSMNGHLRNVKYLEEVEEERAAREAGEPVVTRPAAAGSTGRPATAGSVAGRSAQPEPGSPDA